MTNQKQTTTCPACLSADVCQDAAINVNTGEVSAHDAYTCNACGYDGHEWDKAPTLCKNVITCQWQGETLEFEAWAEDRAHAIEQCENAYPGCVIVSSTTTPATGRVAALAALEALHAGHNAEKTPLDGDMLDHCATVMANAGVLLELAPPIRGRIWWTADNDADLLHLLPVYLARGAVLVSLDTSHHTHIGYVLEMAKADAPAIFDGYVPESHEWLID